jgi:hypothetical protein
MTIDTKSAIRIIPRDSSFLDRRIGSRGEIFYDQSANTLRLYDGQTQSGFKIARTDLINVSNEAFLAKAQAAGVEGSANPAFSTISVAGQSNVVADSIADTLTLTAGSNITITTNPDNSSSRSAYFPGCSLNVFILASRLLLIMPRAFGIYEID